MYTLTCKNLEFSYPSNPTFRLSLPDLDIAMNAPLGIYGLTGSGKSTFGKILGGLLTPTNGSFRFKQVDAEDISKNSEPRILYLPQFPELIFLGMNIAQALKTILKNQADAAEVIVRFAGNLQRLGLDYALVKDRFGYELSAGELRLATIALGLTIAADLTIFDEPTIALSPSGRERLIDVITAFAAQKALMIISHDDRLVRKLCPNVLIFTQGNAIFKGDWKALDQNPSVKQKVGLNLLEIITHRDSSNAK